ncbi:hypothetical protein DL93DRAFT_1175451 [Clavulina sp. PMI_390]|nr:hypothetical protein DL93DRAFT_1175451 [Clavulina sp. PMI_390]
MAPLSLRDLSLLLIAYPLMALAQSNFLSPTQIAAHFNLASSTSLALPTQTMDPNTTATWFQNTSGWQIANNGRIANPQLVNFTKDPFDSKSTSPVLSVTYPAAMYGNNDGTRFSTYFNDSSAGFGTMQISYQVGFPADYQFVKGGKLPGLRGGTPLNGCDGGSNSSTCFSVRLMWRTKAEGEAYGYLQGPSSLCDNEKNVICESTGSGISFGRGSFSFVAGTWNQVDMVVGLNNPVTSKNGYIATYYNGALAINQTGLLLRSSSSVQNIQGMFFS